MRSRACLAVRWQACCWAGCCRRIISATKPRAWSPLASGTLSVLSALVIGLLISFAKGDFDAQSKLIQNFAADLILLDRVMRQYGPETDEARELLQRYTAQKIALTWPEENAADGPRPDAPAALAMLEGVQGKLLTLTPQSEAQRWLQSRALQIGGELAEDRWLLAAESEGSVPLPFLATLVLWLTVLFANFGLFAPRHATVAAALFVCALSLSAAIFLILEMDRPFDGFITSPTADAERAGAHGGLTRRSAMPKLRSRDAGVNRRRRRGAPHELVLHDDAEREYAYGPGKMACRTPRSAPSHEDSWTRRRRRAGPSQHEKRLEDDLSGGR